MCMSAGGVPPMNLNVGLDKDLSRGEQRMAMRNRLRGYYPGRGFGQYAAMFNQDAMARGLGSPSDYMRAAGVAPFPGTMFGYRPGAQMGALPAAFPGVQSRLSGGQRGTLGRAANSRSSGGTGRSKKKDRKSSSSGSSSSVASTGLVSGDRATDLLGQVGSETRATVQAASNQALNNAILEDVKSNIASGKMPEGMLDEIGVERDGDGNITGFKGLSDQANSYLADAEQRLSGSIVNSSRYSRATGSKKKGDINENKLKPKYSRNEAGKGADDAAPPMYVAAKPGGRGLFGQKPDTYAMDVLVPQQKPASISERPAPTQAPTPTAQVEQPAGNSPIVNAVSGDAKTNQTGQEKTLMNLPGRVVGGVGDAIGGAVDAAGNVIANVSSTMGQSAEGLAGAVLGAVNNRTAELEANPEKRYQGAMGLFAPGSVVEAVANAETAQGDESLTQEKLWELTLKKVLKNGGTVDDAKAMWAQRYGE